MRIHGGIQDCLWGQRREGGGVRVSDGQSKEKEETDNQTETDRGRPS